MHTIKRTVLLIIVTLIVLLLLLFMFRLLSPREIDDVHPAIPCETDILERSDILWIIPLYQNESIANNESWCKSIRAMNKSMGIHGVYHSYKEFLIARDTEYIKKGVTAFEQCLGYKPTAFKAPQLALSKENENILRQEHWTIHDTEGQITHKVYHCNDTGRFKNWIISMV